MNFAWGRAAGTACAGLLLLSACGGGDADPSRLQIGEGDRMFWIGIDRLAVLIDLLL